MKMQLKTNAVLLLAAMLFLGGGRVEAGTNALELKPLVQQYLPGARFVPEGAPKPRAIIAASGDALDLRTALLENPAPRKGAGYWLTPTMRYLGGQRMTAASSNAAAGIIQLLLALTRGPGFASQIKYRAQAVDGNWVVEVEHDAAKDRESVPALPPYELLLDASQHVTQIRQRCYAFAGSAAVYDHIVRTVYEREVKLNGGINYPAMLEKEFSKASEQENAQATIKK